MKLLYVVLMTPLFIESMNLNEAYGALYKAVEANLNALQFQMYKGSPSDRFAARHAYATFIDAIKDDTMITEEISRLHHMKLVYVKRNINSSKTFGTISKKIKAAWKYKESTITFTEIETRTITNDDEKEFNIKNCLKKLRDEACNGDIVAGFALCSFHKAIDHPKKIGSPSILFKLGKLVEAGGRYKDHDRSGIISDETKKIVEALRAQIT